MEPTDTHNTRRRLYKENFNFTSLFLRLDIPITYIFSSEKLDAEIK